MTALRDCAFKTGIISVTGKEGEDVGLIGISRVIAVVIDYRLEAGGTANWFG